MEREQILGTMSRDFREWIRNVTRPYEFGAREYMAGAVEQAYVYGYQTAEKASRESEAHGDVCAKVGSARPTFCVLTGEVTDLFGEHRMTIELDQYAAEEWVGSTVEVRVIRDRRG